MKQRNPRLDAIHKTGYEKDGVIIVTGGLTALAGFAFITPVAGEPLPLMGIITNGKLRLAERRKVIKSLLLALKFDYLGDFPQFRTGTRGAAVYKAKDVKI